VIDQVEPLHSLRTTHLQNRMRLGYTRHCRVFNKSTRHFQLYLACLLPELRVHNYIQRHKWNLDPDVMLLYFDYSAWQRQQSNNSNNSLANIHREARTDCELCNYCLC
jgi:hypothetical protein